MESEIKSIDGATKELIVRIPIGEFNKYLNDAFLEAQKHIEMKGFRKGRVPISLIKQRFGKEIEEDTIGDIATDLFNKAVTEQKIEFVGKPSFMKHEMGEEFVEFYFNYDVLPQFELEEYRGLKFFEPVHRVTDEEVEHEIFHILIRNGKTEIAEEIKDDLAIVTVELTKLDEQTSVPVLNTTQQTHIFLHSHTVPDKMREIFIGKKKGETFVARPRLWDESAPDEQYQFKIVEVLQIVPPELSDEFVQEYTNGRLSTVDEFKDEIGFQLQQKWDMQSRDEMVKQVIRKITDMHEFDLPKSVVWETASKLAADFYKKYYQEMQRENFKPEDLLEDFIPIAENQVKWAIIKKKIIEKENIKVEDYDIDDIVNGEANRTGKDHETVKKSIYENSYIIDTILEKKTLDLLISFSETEEIDFEEYRRKEGSGELFGSEGNEHSSAERLDAEKQEEGK